MINKHSQVFITNSWCSYLLNTKSNLKNSTFYGLITIDNCDNIILLFYLLDTSIHGRSIISPILFKANRAIAIHKLLELHTKIFNQISTSHALYLGKELMKAEFTLLIEHSYIQN